MVPVVAGLGAFYSRAMKPKADDLIAFGKRLRLARRVMGWKATRAFANALGEWGWLGLIALAVVLNLTGVDQVLHEAVIFHDCP